MAGFCHVIAGYFDAVSLPKVVIGREDLGRKAESPVC